MAIVCSALASIRGSCAPEIARFTWFKNYAMVPSTPHQSKIGKGLVETLSSMPSTKRPPRPGVPLQAESQVAFSAVARRILGGACEREEGHETKYCTPVISPYNLYRKRGSLPQGIRALIASKKRMNQIEQVHSSKMDHCSLPASTKGTIGAIIPWTKRTSCYSQDCPAGYPVFRITGANQVPASVMATLHHQLVFRLQNHSLDLPNQGSRDAPMVLANSGTEVPMIIQIPRQILRKDLEKLVPTEWITNYESLQQQHETIRATDFRFKRLLDGRVKTIFQTQPAGEPSNPEFQLMITPIPIPEQIITPIASFGTDGHRIYTDWIDGHFIWDVDPSMCDPECSCGEESDDDDDDYVWSDYESDEDDEFSSCNDSDDDYDEPDPDDHLSLRTPQPCIFNMIQTFHLWKEGKLKPLTQVEEVLNWQTTNARAQNRSLTTLDAKKNRVLAKPLFTTQPLFGESPPPSPPDYSKYFFMASSIPTDLPKAPPKQPRKKYTPEEKQKAPQTSTPPVSQQHVSDTLMATQSKPETYPITPEPFVIPSTESYETPSEPTEPVHLCEEEDEDTNSISSEDFNTISEGDKDSDANLADITSILMADAESSRRPQEQGAENVEDSDSDPVTTEPTVTQPDI
ncbi:UNVERIFIED_CONTAM: polyprotein [Sesamum latifolium]|uniref:Polyprotein n=1 Tax=Sesamum latifolium TaxID=2727402 RepID=A0AAW2WSF2_9LAMI